MWMLLNNYHYFFKDHSHEKRLRLLNQWYDIYNNRLGLNRMGSFSELEDIPHVYWKLRFKPIGGYNMVDYICGHNVDDTDKSYKAEWERTLAFPWCPDNEGE